jgi:hypothetical protein
LEDGTVEGRYTILKWIGYSTEKFNKMINNALNAQTDGKALYLKLEKYDFMDKNYYSPFGQDEKEFLIKSIIITKDVDGENYDEYSLEIRDNDKDIYNLLYAETPKDKLAKFSTLYYTLISKFTTKADIWKIEGYPAQFQKCGTLGSTHLYYDRSGAYVKVRGINAKIGPFTFAKKDEIKSVGGEIFREYWGKYFKIYDKFCEVTGIESIEYGRFYKIYCASNRSYSGVIDLYEIPRSVELAGKEQVIT